MSVAEVGASAHRLEARGLQKSYGARMVVKDVHLAVDSGEVVGLLGPNGAGKTTTLPLKTTNWFCRSILPGWSASTFSGLKRSAFSAWVGIENRPASTARDDTRRRSGRAPKWGMSSAGVIKA